CYLHYALPHTRTRAPSLPRRSTALTTTISAAPSVASSGTDQATRTAGTTAKRHWPPWRAQTAYSALALPALSVRSTERARREAPTSGVPGRSLPSHVVAGTSAWPA